MTTSRTPTPTAARWPERPAAAAAVRALVLAGPLALAVGAGALSARLLGPVPGRALLVLVVTTVVLVLTDRLARRLLPLAALLRLSLLFPDRAPGRLRLALRPGSTRELVRLRAAGDEAGAAAAELLGLLAGVARHDPATRRHSERVRAYVDLLSGALGLAEGDRDRLRWAALVHDLGKTEVPVRVLRKPARLDEQEWEMVRRHPAAGARMAAGLRPFLGPWYDAVGQHHERWDGTGYPQGLAGEQISRGARIVAVADAFEVMTARRPYSRPVDPAAARAELVRYGSRQFDPEVVRALLGLSLERLRRVLGPVAWLGVLPAAGARLPDPDHLLHAGSDAGLPAVPPQHAPDVGLGVVGLHPQAHLHPVVLPPPEAVSSGHDALGAGHAHAAGGHGTPDQH